MAFVSVKRDLQQKDLVATKEEDATIGGKKLLKCFLNASGYAECLNLLSS